ncbi:MAG: hypothetical protein WCA44_07995, partial [Acidobacteriaceae bacterium]
MPKTRREKDSLGFIAVPADALYGAQTARAVENFPISEMRAHPLLIRAIGMVKRAAAEANKELGTIRDSDPASTQPTSAKSGQMWGTREIWG